LTDFVLLPVDFVRFVDLAGLLAFSVLSVI
jgi:hypothetical protein